MTNDLREHLAAANDRAALLAAVAGLEAGELAMRDAERIARRLGELAPAADLRLLLLGNHTLEPLAKCTAAAALARGVVVESHVGPFAQHMQMLLDPSLGLAELDPQVIFLSLDLQQVLTALPAGLATLSTEARRALVEDAVGAVAAWVEAARGVTRATLLIGNFWRPRRPHLGLADAKLQGGEAALYAVANARLLEAYADDPQVHVVDLDHAVASAGRAAASDPRMRFLAKLAWSEAALPGIAELLSRYLAQLVLPPKKCLVLDLDNTLWGGVLGEEGPDGIRIAEGDPVGEAFRAFQLAIKGVQGRGLLLAACSKNNRADVEEVFRLRPEMPLGLEDFAAVADQLGAQARQHPRHRRRAEHRHGQPGLRRRQPGRVRAGAADAARGHHRPVAARSVELCRAAARHARARAPGNRGRGPAQDRAVSRAGSARGYASGGDGRHAELSREPGHRRHALGSDARRADPGASAVRQDQPVQPDDQALQAGRGRGLSSPRPTGIWRWSRPRTDSATWASSPPFSWISAIPLPSRWTA